MSAFLRNFPLPQCLRDKRDAAMKAPSKVVWYDGMYLGPHHFQSQSRYFEDLVHFAASALWFAPYGFSRLELDAETLGNGTVSLQHARGIFQDGLAFNMPDCDPLPEPRNISTLFDPMADAMTVFLAVPARSPDRANCALPGDRSDFTTRYEAFTEVLPDENTGHDEKPVTLGRKNVCLLLEEELPQDVVSLPLVRVMREGSGGLVSDRAFLPPLLQAGASEYLVMLIRRLIGILEDKSRTCAGCAPEPGYLRAGLSSGEVASFWFLHCVNSSLASLRNLCFSKQEHPEGLFRELSRLAGALCTFVNDSDPASLPLYDHRRLGECFEALDQHIRAHLDVAVPPSYARIPLEQVAPYIFSGPVANPQCLGRSRWILGIQASCGEANLLAKVPRLVKISSRKLVSDLVGQAPGLVLTHLPSPPPEIPARLDGQYFSINREGHCWEELVATKEVGVYVPSDLPSPKLELLVILDSSR